ncbi:MAG: hypothetical protein M8861_08375 [marine benthic group bacterium]|nr:hypothetical protein [Gemmatimonadota bacterium]
MTRILTNVPGRSRGIVPGLLCLALASGLTAAALHPLHLSTSHLAVDEQAAWLRIRMFKDDLEAALAARAGVDSLSLEPSAEHDSLFLAYFSEAFGLRFNGVEVAGAIESSGEDLESGGGDLRIWWYQVRFDGTEPINGVEIRNEVLYESFRDQRNIVRVLHAPTETRKTLYFAAPDEGWSEVTW